MSDQDHLSTQIFHLDQIRDTVALILTIKRLSFPTIFMNERLAIVDSIYDQSLLFDKTRVS